MAARTKFDVLRPEIDGEDLRGDLYRYVVGQQQSFNEVRETLLQLHEEAHQIRERRNVKTSRTDAGTRVKSGDPVLVTEADAGRRGKRPIANLVARKGQ